VAATSAERSVVARLGGEEFAVLVVGLAPSAIARLADHVCAAGRRAQTIFNEKTIGSTVSVGVAMLKSGGIDALLKSADDAVYEAKRSGRDRWAFAGDATAAGDPKPARAMGGNHAWSKS
jgi:diguanylate cyclase (GGDEF)-like protein